jgi:hypothetical protein
LDSAATVGVTTNLKTAHVFDVPYAMSPSLVSVIFSRIEEVEGATHMPTAGSSIPKEFFLMRLEERLP